VEAVSHYIFSPPGRHTSIRRLRNTYLPRFSFYHEQRLPFLRWPSALLFFRDHPPGNVSRPKRFTRATTRPSDHFYVVTPPGNTQDGTSCSIFFLYAFSATFPAAPMTQERSRQKPIRTRRGPVQLYRLRVERACCLKVRFSTAAFLICRIFPFPLFVKPRWESRFSPNSLSLHQIAHPSIFRTPDAAAVDLCDSQSEARFALL